MDPIFLMILSNLLNFVLLCKLFEVVFVVSRPLSNWKFGNFENIIVKHLILTCNCEAFSCGGFLNFPRIPFIPGIQMFDFTPSHHSLELPYDLPRIVHRNEC